MTKHHDHADERTVALFGAGTGLGASVAHRFGREGFRVALIARNTEALEKRVAELEAVGIEAGGFPAHLTDIAGIPALVRSIEAKLGPIDVAIYAPMAPDVAFVPAVQLNSAQGQAKRYRACGRRCPQFRFHAERRAKRRWGIRRNGHHWRVDRAFRSSPSDNRERSSAPISGHLARRNRGRSLVTRDAARPRRGDSSSAGDEATWDVICGRPHMEAESDKSKAATREPSSDVKPIKKAKFVVLTTDDDAGVCNVGGECS